MGKMEQDLKNYFKKESGNIKKTFQCLGDEIFLDYLEGRLDSQRRKDVEEHFCQCSFCLSQLNLVFEAKESNIRNIGGKVPSKLIKKAKALVNDDNPNSRRRVKRMKKNLFFAGMILFFITSFIWPKYFVQSLVAALILGIRWTFESEGGRTLIMVVDSWRRNSHDQDDAIVKRLKDRFKSPHL